MKIIKWQCPDCKRVGNIEEVVEGLNQRSPVEAVDDDILDYGISEYEPDDDTRIVAYQCRWCGCVVKDDRSEIITAVDALIKYLSDNNLLEDEDGDSNTVS